MYDASKLAEETDAKLSGLIKQVSHCCWPGQAKWSLTLAVLALWSWYMGASMVQDCWCYAGRGAESIQLKAHERA